jgi:hypothetical protein
METIAQRQPAWHAGCTMFRMATSPSTRLSAVLLTSFLVLATAACKKDRRDDPDVDGPDTPSRLAEDGTDSATAETDAEVVTSSLIAASAAGGPVSLASNDMTGGNLGTRGIGDGAKAIYVPRGCLVVTSDPTAKTVTYAFKNCAGPYGIFRISGTIVATYEASPNKLVLDIVGNDLLVNRASVDWAAHAEIKDDGATRKMRWRGQVSGTTPRGKEFKRTNEKIISWRLGERCFAVAGVSEGEVRGRYLRTEIADFRRCQGFCPEAGGRITITNAEAKEKVEIVFDGTSRATYTTPKGSITFDLACKAED